MERGGRFSIDNFLVLSGAVFAAPTVRRNGILYTISRFI